MNEKKMAHNTQKTRMKTIAMSKLRKMELFCQWKGGGGITRRERWGKRGKNRLKIKWTTWKIYTHHNLVCLLLLLLHFPFMNVNFRCSSTVKFTQKHNTKTFACSDLFHPATCFGQLFWPSSGTDKVQVCKENCYRGGLPSTNWYIKIL